MTHARGPIPAMLEMEDCAYNLFRNKQRSELFCAVPEYHPVPGFLGPEQWSFVRALRPADPRPPGFNDRAAFVGAQFNGFYLFQTTAMHGQIAA